MPDADPPADDADDRINFMVRLKPRHAERLAVRAAAHGEDPQRHIETILREFFAHHDTFDPAPPPAADIGMVAMARRR